MAKAFRTWLVIFGVVVMAIAAAHLLVGQSTYLGGGEVNATMDSDLRFFNLLFLLYGLAFVWAAADIRAHARLIDLLGLVFFAGGLSRLLAWSASGRPSWFYVAMIPVELLVPVLHYWWLRAALGRVAGPR
ncbi:MAG: DUF4345 domain-containing protein [Nocardioides sp.]|uniref:DUF4345 domain-containing protein n=1 Tax=Nocardioides sp. TaxID=35761 RepID=UPI0039E30A47